MVAQRRRDTRRHRDFGSNHRYTCLEAIMTSCICCNFCLNQFIHKDTILLRHKRPEITEDLGCWQQQPDVPASDPCQAASLRSLVGVHNKLKGSLQKLLTCLPEAVKGLIGLQGLYVDHNLLMELPKGH
ncbi:hypothetical protein GWK47_018300 [Chionoecetes opilio]|uniref:Uncharacterized protein n=1 Tax=Chionoecetes opilio TaxID=41210 RepID=A0A8J5CIP6_CHIOP|nr:hypothetical protein GWK47_018300 [Chionoecetes opilio]